MMLPAAETSPETERPGGGFRSRLLASMRNRLALGLVSRSVHIGLSRPVGLGLSIPLARVPLSVRPLRPADIDILLPADAGGHSRAEQNEIEQRRRLAAIAPGNCFVAVNESSGEPCFMAWLIGADSETAKLLEGTPRLQPHQAVVEYAYVPPRHRGLGIMAPAGLMVAEQAAGVGATETIAFIGETNIPSLKGARRAGFRPYMRHVRTHFLLGLLHADRFTRLQAGEDGWPPALSEQFAA